jgi:hypothetical protein
MFYSISARDEHYGDKIVDVNLPCQLESVIEEYFPKGLRARVTWNDSHKNTGMVHLESAAGQKMTRTLWVEKLEVT